MNARSTHLAMILAAASAVACLHFPAATALSQAMPAAAGEVAQTDVAAEANQLATEGVQFLLSRQNEDGSWGNEKMPPAITAIAVQAIVRHPDYTYDSPQVKKAYDWLQSKQLADGGIYTDLLANYNTAIVVSSLAAADDQALKPTIDKAVAYLRKLQWTPDTIPEFDDAQKGDQIVKDENDPFYGGWGYGGRSRGAGRPDMSNLQMTLDALHDAGLKADDPAFQRALIFVTRQQNFSETNTQSWAGNDGGFIYGPSADRNGESLAGEFTTPDGQRRLRSYGSMTYAGLKSMIYAGLSKDDPRVKAAWEWVTGNWTLDENPGMRAGNPDQAQNGLFYYFHTLARALNTYDEPNFTTPDGQNIDWRQALVGKLASLQNDDKSWTGDKRWMEDNPILTTAYVVNALHEVRKDLEEHPAR